MVAPLKNINLRAAPPARLSWRSIAPCSLVALTWMWCVPVAFTQPPVSITGRITAEGRWFPQSPALATQDDHGGGIGVEGDLRYTPPGSVGVRLAVAGHGDNADDGGYRWDVREGHVYVQEDTWRLLLGLQRVAWGVSDVFPVVDVVNQRERIDWLDRAEKLGQPLIGLTTWLTYGRLDLWVMPLFRPFPFPSERARLRPDRTVASADALYESGTTYRTFDLALRYHLPLDRMDLAVHFFEGRNRMPFLIPNEELPAAVQPGAHEPDTVYVPFYEELLQAGLELQWTTGPWLWKAELAYRSGFFDDYVLSIGGFERTHYAIGGGVSDWTWVVEYAYDARGKSPTANTILDNDIFAGGRWAWNDLASTEVSGGTLIDLEIGEVLATLQAQRRIGPHTQLKLDAWWLAGTAESSPLHALRRDDFVRIQWIRFF